MFLHSIDPHLREIETALDASLEYTASAKDVNLKFNLKVDGRDDHLTIDIVNGGTRIYSYSSSDPSFQLSARREQWENFFQPIPSPPFQSFWGMLRIIGSGSGVRVLGDSTMFAKHARTWRLFLDIARGVTSKTESKLQYNTHSNIEPEDFLSGRYIHTSTPLFGRARVFIESAGSGAQQVLLLHTAGSDSRQYHALMNMPALQSRFTMHALDLPGHGRSDLGTNQVIGDLSLDEDNYISVIRQIIQKLKLTDLIVCGASMAGQICLAIGLRAIELNVKGVIPCEACEHIPYSPPIYAYQGADQSMLNPETVCGMMSPTSPEEYKRQVWWGYSNQGQNVFKGDLRFYFQGWDGRGRMKDIECPVYMLTGRYDYSCTPEMSRRTSEEIRKGKAKDVVEFEVMEGLGHFPASENPEKFVEYFLKAVYFVEDKGKRE